jgi:hypothetical protein
MIPSSTGAFTTLYRFLSEYGPERLALTDDRRYYGFTSSHLVRLSVLDLVGVSVNVLASVVAPGSSFSVTDTVGNMELSNAGSFTVRFYLSNDTMKSPNDKRLAARREVASVASGDQSEGVVTLKVPNAMNLGSYRVLACADDLNVVAETNETNNCVASRSHPFSSPYQTWWSRRSATLHRRSGMPRASKSSWLQPPDSGWGE